MMPLCTLTSDSTTQPPVPVCATFGGRVAGFTSIPVWMSCRSFRGCRMLDMGQQRGHQDSTVTPCTQQLEPLGGVTALTLALVLVLMVPVLVLTIAATRTTVRAVANEPVANEPHRHSPRPTPGPLLLTAAGAIDATAGSLPRIDSPTKACASATLRLSKPWQSACRRGRSGRQRNGKAPPRWVVACTSRRAQQVVVMRGLATLEWLRRLPGVGCLVAAALPRGWWMLIRTPACCWHTKWMNVEMWMLRVCASARCIGESTGTLAMSCALEPSLCETLHGVCRALVAVAGPRLIWS